jgi:hypothetical protein
MAQPLPTEPTPTPRESRRQRADRRRAKAGELWLQGLSYRQIAEQGGFGNPGNAHRLVTEFLDRTAAPDPGTIAHQRRVEELRLDEIWRMAWPKADAGDTSAQRVLIEVSRSRVALKGLARPTIVQLDTPGGTGPDVQRSTRTLAEILPPAEFSDARTVRDQAMALHRILPRSEQVS